MEELHARWQRLWFSIVQNAKMGSPQAVSSSVFDTKAKHKMAWGTLTACLSQKPAVLERALVD